MDLCVCCGRPVPEGTWICEMCKKKYGLKQQTKQIFRPLFSEQFLF